MTRRPRLKTTSAAVPAASLLAMLTLLAAPGCSPEQERRVTRTTSHADLTTYEDEFDRGRDMLFKLYQYDSGEGSLRCSLFFNQWLRHQQAGDWSASPLVAKLPRQLREFSLIQKLDSKELSTDDVEYMEAMVWFRDIGRWVGDGALDEELEAWITSQEELGEDRARLALAARMFDWTIRNLQLLPFQLGPDEQLYMPGALRTPRMAALLGVGDVWERARVFIQLCRQAEIDAVMLALTPDQAGQQPLPWLPAVRLGGKLYLFDTKLGLPVPGPGGEGIATLAEARSQAEVLENLSLGSTLPYPVQADKLAPGVIALLDAAPEALSLRMHLLEGRLTGEHRLTLTVDSRRLTDELKDMDLSVQLWTVPIEAARYKRFLEVTARNNPAAAAEIRRREALFVGTAPLIMGRKMHLHGQFSKSEDYQGAKLRYMEMRIADQHLAALPVDKDIQKMLGVEQDIYQSDEDWQRELMGLQQMFLEAKMHGSYWIGLVHFEEGNYEAARDWFAVRVLQEQPNSAWADGARYNLARTYEKLGEIERARELYLEDNGSPQRHGNLLRARELREELEQAP